MLEHFWYAITDPMTWRRMWEDFLTLVTQGTPPVYVQYLIATVIFLAYLLFFYDPKRERLKGIRRRILFIPGLIYSISLIIITFGGLNFLGTAINPETYNKPLLTIKEKIHTTIDITRQ